MERDELPVLQKTNTKFFQINRNQNFDPGEDCVSMIFLNKGLSNVTVGDGLILTPGQFIAINQPEGYKDVTKYRIAFSATVNNLLVIGQTNRL